MIEEIHKDFCKFIDLHSKYSYYTRSINLQRESILECDKYLLSIKKNKRQAIIRENESEANNIFHMQCVVNAIRSYTLMWILLKENDFQKSWSSLVDAQDYISIALRIKSYEGIRNLESRMSKTESNVFPNSISYLSSGFTETIGKCSICKKNFAICEHIEDNIYMGRFCQRISRKILDVNHVALVENPRDRRCIVTNISDEEGNEIDTFTLESTGENFNHTEGVNCKGIALAFSKLDLQ